jgi:uncharacterized membrane protein YbjE (DUF340 family)
MSTLVSLLLLLVFLVGGFIAARLKLLKYTVVTDRVFSVALYLLLFSMGLKLGQNRDVLANLSMVGILAVSSTLFACAGTVILQILFVPVYRKLERAKSGGTSPEAALSSGAETSRMQPLQGSRKLSMLFHNLKKPLILLALVVLGTGVGYVMPLVTIVRDGTISNWILYFLLFIIGMQMNGSGASLGKMLFQPAVLLVPAVTIVGTLAGSLGTLMFDGMTPGRALALGSGFGWYSLSGVLISNLGDPMLGAASFIANLLRETLAFLSIPLLKFTGRCESGIGIAGATSMDVTLPVVEDSWGAGVIPLSVAHGVILSFLVPFLVPLFMSF